MTETRICAYCRSRIPPDVVLCPNCGAEVKPAGPPRPITPPGAQASQAATRPQAGASSQSLSITAFVLSLVGLAAFITLIPGLIIGIIALKKEPRGRTFAWIAVAISGGVLLISLTLILIGILSALAAPESW